MPSDKKDVAQLDAERIKTDTKTSLFRVQLSQGLAVAIKQRSGIIVFYALQRTPRGYTFEASEPDEVRAFWHALTDVYYRPPTGRGGRAIGQAAATKRMELRSIIEAVWPEILVE